jgi:hypothetical protein
MYAVAANSTVLRMLGAVLPIQDSVAPPEGRTAGGFDAMASSP